MTMSGPDSSNRSKVKEPSLREDRQPLICERWMSLNVQTVKPLDSVAHARALLEEHRFNQLLVVAGQKLVGIVTDRDLRDAVNTVTTSATLAGIAEQAPQTPDQIPIESVMTSNVITLSPHSTLVTAAELMRRERIGSVPIVEGNSVAGIITRGDILEAFVARECAVAKPTSRTSAREGQEHRRRTESRS
jgi:acetoin utilization protein AcuB